MVRTVRPQHWGRQREGYPPGGAMDQFSASIAARLVGCSDRDCELLLEIVQSRGQLQTAEAICIACSGAPLKLSCNDTPLACHQSHLLPALSTLQWEPKADRLGYRSYLAIACRRRALSSHKRYRKPWRAISRWYPPQQLIRILEGPETTAATSAYLTRQRWQIHPQSSNQGLRLDNTRATLSTPSLPSMASAPVLDGTVQLTPAGPIVLMRERQTVGGYPRIAQVIDCDIDVLAQYRPGQWLRFETIGIETANALNRLQRRQRQAALLPCAWRIPHST